MKIPFFFVVIILLISASCSKNKFTTKPQITIKSIGPDIFSRTDIFRIVLGFTDKEGDIHDSLYMHVHVINQKQKGLATEFHEFGYQMPFYPDKTQGEFQLNFTRQFGGSSYPFLFDPPVNSNENDTAIFSFNVLDAGKHMSDTVTYSNQVIILYQ